MITRTRKPVWPGLKSTFCAAAIVTAHFFGAPAQASPASEYGTIAGGATVGAIGLSSLGNENSAALGNVSEKAAAAGAYSSYNDAKNGASSRAAPSGSSPAVHLYGAEIVNSQNRIPVEVRKGSLIRLSAPATTVFITNPDIADVQIKSPTLIYVFGKAPGETSLFALSDNDKVLFNGIVSVRHNLSRLQGAIKQFLPGTDVAIDSVDNSLILTGRVDSAAEATDVGLLAANFLGKGVKIINRVQIASPSQINLRVRIAEVSREIVKQIGFRWDLAVSNGDYLVGLVTGGGATSAGENALFGSFRSSNFNFDTVLDAMETEGLISVLAEPNLTALSGETANFLAGGEFPIPVPQDDETITIEFKKFGIGLSFTPTILSDSQINLKISPEVSQLTSAGSISIAGFSIPALTTRRAETTVELGSGQSFAIAGLLQNNVIRNLNKLPGLGDLPILGALFRSDSFQREETELVIIVTPYIVRPVSAPRMALPNDGLDMPSDVERIIRGSSYSAHPFNETPVTRDQKGRRLIGPAGFSLN
ncbi:MAG: type II and III secretion system protein family protein [Sphingomonadales bacterium]